MKFTIAALTTIAMATAATIPSAAWSTLTPNATYAGAMTDFSSSFGIQIVTISASSTSASASSTAVAKRQVIQQIGDGQIQAQSASSTTAVPTVSVVNQIGDGQIQNNESTPTTTSAPKTTASVVNQIGDGQIQNNQSTATKTTASVVNQIGDGQIQNNKSATTSTASVVNQITDGQIQNNKSTKTASVVNQITDGQIQNESSAAVASQATDGPVQATATSSADSDYNFPVSCKSSTSLAMTLKDSMLTDSKGRVGAIVANRQFQFDGPPPQAGSIYAAGWSITSDGKLALGDSDVFYQCKSGDFYNLYDENVAAQCEPVYLSIVELVTC